MLEGEMNYGSTWRMAFWAFLHLRMRVCYRVLVSITLKKKTTQQTNITYLQRDTDSKVLFTEFFIKCNQRLHQEAPGSHLLAFGVMYCPRVTSFGF